MDGLARTELVLRSECPHRCHWAQIVSIDSSYTMLPVSSKKKKKKRAERSKEIEVFILAGPYSAQKVSFLTSGSSVVVIMET